MFSLLYVFGTCSYTIVQFFCYTGATQQKFATRWIHGYTICKLLISASYTMFIKIFYEILRAAVNPYVAGSSPAARATIYRRFLRFFFTFAVAICSGIKNQKSSKNTYFLYILYTKLYICYTGKFLYILSTSATPISARLSEDSQHPLTHGIFVRVSPVKNDFFNTKINTLY